MTKKRTPKRSPTVHQKTKETAKRPPYTPEEDMALWRFAMEDHPGYGTHTMWELFAETGGTWRHWTSLSSRFYKVLVLRLPQIPFHAETKLDICARLKIPVEAEFLKVLEKDADIGVDDARFVKSFTMKPTAGPNLDKQLSDKELLKITSVFVKTVAPNFSREEDAEMWKFAAENHDQYYGNSKVFWEMMVRKLNWERTAKSVMCRFKTIRLKLHETNFEPEIKLMLYKTFKIPVDFDYLELLKDHYEWKIDDEQCVCWYQKKVVQSPDQEDQGDQAEKRKCPSEDTNNVIKKSRLSENVVENPPSRNLKLQEIIDSAMSADDVAQKDLVLEPPQLEMEQLDDVDDDSRIPTVSLRQILKATEDVLPNPDPVEAVDNALLTEITRVVNENMANFETKMTRMGQNLERSLKNDISGVATTVGSLKEEMRSEKSNGTGDEISSTRKKCLQNLLKLVSSIQSPELTDIEKRIEQAIQESEDDENPPPVHVLRPMLEAILTIISHNH